jgi:hypothetical protein
MLTSVVSRRHSFDRSLAVSFSTVGIGWFSRYAAPIVNENGGVVVQ